MGLFGEPMGTGVAPNLENGGKKKHPEARPLKSDEKMRNTNPQNLHYLNMATEG